MICLLSGGQNAGGGCRRVCYPVASLPRHVSLQQFRNHVFDTKLPRSLVPGKKHYYICFSLAIVLLLSLLLII